MLLTFSDNHTYGFVITSHFKIDTIFKCSDYSVQRVWLISVRVYDPLWSINWRSGFSISKCNSHLFQMRWQSTNLHASDHSTSNDVSLRGFICQYRRSFTIHFILAPRVLLLTSAVVHASFTSRQPNLCSRSADPCTQIGGHQLSSLTPPIQLSTLAVNHALDTPPFMTFKCVEHSTDCWMVKSSCTDVELASGGSVCIVLTLLTFIILTQRWLATPIPLSTSRYPPHPVDIASSTTSCLLPFIHQWGITPRIQLSILAVVHTSFPSPYLSSCSANSSMLHNNHLSCHAPQIQVLKTAVFHAFNLLRCMREPSYLIPRIQLLTLAVDHILDSPPFKPLKCAEFSDGLLFRPPTSKMFNGW